MQNAQAWNENKKINNEIVKASIMPRKWGCTG